MLRLKSYRRRILQISGVAGICLLAAGIFAAGRRIIARDPGHANITAAGYVHKFAKTGQITLSYVEGPDNGPPLILLHAQFLDWYSYNRVLPALARHFHVYDIDYPGHGATQTPADYPMTANRIGTDLARFIQTTIGQPVFVSGNSSGGLLALWLAANRPAQIRAAVLEDPPLFSSEYPRIKQTIADRAFVTSFTGARDHVHDFLLYWIHQNAPFFRRQVGALAPFLLTQAVRISRLAHPGQPPEIRLLHNETIRMLVRGLDSYDPRFGAAFYDGSWNRGFDHATALKKVTCPVLLMQANSYTRPDGVLMGAMGHADAKRAMALLQHGTYRRVDSGHVINIDRPDHFVRVLEHFFLHSNRP